MLDSDASLEDRAIAAWANTQDSHWDTTLIRYSYCRPHSALAGRVPVEALFGIQDQRPRSNIAPRGRSGDPDSDCPFEVAFLDPDFQTLPILVPKAA